jgi:hypothetical protein
MKIRPVGAQFFHTDRQADMTKQIVAFRSLWKAPKTFTNVFHLLILDYEALIYIYIYIYIINIPTFQGSRSFVDVMIYGWE